MNNAITGLDIGTSKICAAIAAPADDGTPEILGTGLVDARGINKGFVSNLDKLIDSVCKAVRAAECQAGIKTHKVITNISGSSLAGVPSESVIHLSRRGREITRADVEKAVETARNVSLTLERDSLYCVTQEFMVDDSENLENALGLFGTKLKARLYVITALATHIQNISKAVSYAGYEPLEIIPTVIPAAEAILNEEETRSGAVMMDIGGGITELAIYKDGALRFFDTVNVGGMDLTAALSANLKVSFRTAEMIKKRTGSILKEDLSADKNSIYEADGRHITVESDITNAILKTRFEEILHILMERLKSSAYFTGSIPSLTVTGGGSLLHGVLEACEELSGMPLKRWRVGNVKADPSMLSNPVYSAAIAIAKYGLVKHKTCRRRSFAGAPILSNAFHKVRDFINDYF